MPGEFSPVTLRVEEAQIPAVRAAIDQALVELSEQLVRLERDGWIRVPWLGDPISEEVRVDYNTRVMDAADGPYAALVAYQEELIRIRDTLKVQEDNYRRTEGDNTTLAGPRA